MHRQLALNAIALPTVAVLTLALLALIAIGWFVLTPVVSAMYFFGE